MPKQATPNYPIRANNITVVKSGRTLLEDVTVEAARGELVGLIGPNGAGKSTLLSVLAGIEPPKSGVVELNGVSIAKVNRSQRARSLAWLEQAGSIHWPMSVERLVMLGRIPHLPRWGTLLDDDLLAVEKAMASANCTHLRHQTVRTLSGGEKSRVLLARALASQPEVLLADEPVSALDLGYQLQTMQLLEQYVQLGNTAIVVLHDLSLAARFCTRLYLLHKGKLFASGAVASVLSSDNIEAVYGVRVISGCGEAPWIIPVETV